MAYVDLPPALQIPKQDLDPTFISQRVHWGFSVRGSDGKERCTSFGGGASNAGITKADMEALIAAAKSSGGPVQTIRVEQLPIKLSIDETYKM